MSTTLLDGHDAVLFDLDGTVYRGGEPAPGALEAIQEVHRRGVAVRYVTNNASKPAQAVVDHLAGFGIDSEVAEVSTSAQAGAAVVVDKLPAGSRVLVLGAPALEAEVERLGLVPVREFVEQPVAVVQGLFTELGYRDFAEACLAIRAGALWVACNADRTLPTERGLLPGNGALVELLRAATDQEPVVAGKPERPLLDRAVNSAGASAPLMVGDRLDTDIAGARAAGMPSLMVLTGVNTPRDLLECSPDLRPDHVAADLRGLLEPPSAVTITEQPTWSVQVDETAMTLSGSGEPLSALRALCAAWWAVGSGPIPVRAADAEAREALRALELD